jgi:phosphatidylethanolamine-binding protein (PEBP) family uncharacterized protein
MRVYLGSKKLRDRAVLTRQEAMEHIHIQWNANGDKLYTVIIYDNDAPYPDNNYLSPFIHLLEVNIPGDDMNSGDVMVRYMPPNPPTGSGPHNYTIAVYEQRYHLRFDSKFVREDFPVNLFAIYNKLSRVDLFHFTV